MNTDTNTSTNISYNEFKSLFSIRTTYYGRLVRLMTYPFFLILDKLDLSPNFITFMSTYINIIAVASFIPGHLFGMITGLVLLQLGYIFDCLDGIIARRRNKTSVFGGFFDLVLDRVDNYIIYFGLFIQQIYSGAIELSLYNIVIFLTGASLYFIYVNTSMLKGLRLNLEKPSIEKYGLAKVLSYQLLDNGLFLLLISLSVILNIFLEFVFLYGIYNLVFAVAIIWAGYKEEHEDRFV